MAKNFACTSMASGQDRQFTLSCGRKCRKSARCGVGWAASIRSDGCARSGRASSLRSRAEIRHPVATGQRELTALVDQISAERRSAVMARIKGKNTGPEMRVRRVAHAMGLRFRLHRKDLPGNPDLVFPRLRVALFVHGCFWHRHGCYRTTSPRTRAAFWSAKFGRNICRDRKNSRRLRTLGWRVIVIWECSIRDRDRLRRRLDRLFGEHSV